MLIIDYIHIPLVFGWFRVMFLIFSGGIILSIAFMLYQSITNHPISDWCFRSAIGFTLAAILCLPGGGISSYLHSKNIEKDSKTYQIPIVQAKIEKIDGDSFVIATGENQVYQMPNRNNILNDILNNSYITVFDYEGVTYLAYKQ